MTTDKFRQAVADWQTALPDDTKQTQQTIARVLALPKKRRRWPWVTGLVAAAAALLIVGGVYVAPINQVLAQVPGVGQWFKRLAIYDRETAIVVKHGTLQKVAGKKTSNGVTMTLKGAYVQGRTVALSGTLSGVETPAAHGRLFSYSVAAGGTPMTVRASEWAATKDKGHYTFTLKGTISQAASKHTVHLPLTITKVLGQPVTLKYNLKLAPSKVTALALTGTASQAGYQLKVLGAERYAGGTGSVTVRITQPQAVGLETFDLTKLTVNGGKRNYMLGQADEQLTAKAASGRTRTITYKVKALPKQVKQLTFAATAAYQMPDQRVALTAMPTTATASRDTVRYTFEAPSLSGNQLVLRYRLTGTGYSDEALALDQLVAPRLSLELKDQAAWQKLVTSGAADQSPVTVTTEIADAKTHLFQSIWHLDGTVLAGKTLNDLALSVPMALQPTKTVKPITVNVK